MDHNFNERLKKFITEGQRERSTHLVEYTPTQREDYTCDNFTSVSRQPRNDDFSPDEDTESPELDGLFQLIASWYSKNAAKNADVTANAKVKAFLAGLPDDISMLEQNTVVMERTLPQHELATMYLGDVEIKPAWWQIGSAKQLLDRHLPKLCILMLAVFSVANQIVFMMFEASTMDAFAIVTLSSLLMIWVAPISMSMKVPIVPARRLLKQNGIFVCILVVAQLGIAFCLSASISFIDLSKVNTCLMFGLVWTALIARCWLKERLSIAKCILIVLVMLAVFLQSDPKWIFFPDEVPEKSSGSKENIIIGMGLTLGGTLCIAIVGPISSRIQLNFMELNYWCCILRCAISLVAIFAFQFTSNCKWNIFLIPASAFLILGCTAASDMGFNSGTGDTTILTSLYQVLIIVFGFAADLTMQGGDLQLSIFALSGLGLAVLCAIALSIAK